MKNMDFEEIKAMITGDPDLIVLVNLETGQELHYKDTDVFGPMDGEFAGLDYYERTRLYAEKYVSPEDREAFRIEMEPERLKGLIRQGQTLRVEYNADFGRGEVRMRTSYIPAGAADDGLYAIKAVEKI